MTPNTSVHTSVIMESHTDTVVDVMLILRPQCHKSPLLYHQGEKLGHVGMQFNHSGFVLQEVFPIVQNKMRAKSTKAGKCYVCFHCCFCEYYLY